MSTLQPLGREFTAGAVFGAALYSAGVYHPSVIESQLRFESFQMLQVMLGASAASALVFHLADRSGFLSKQVRAPSSLGWFAYDGNVIGGAFIGAGMALSGACPGTVIVQAATGIPAGPFVALGGVLGAAAWLAIKPQATGSNACATPKSGKSTLTIANALGISEFGVLLGWETLCLVAVAVLLKHWPKNDHALVGPVAGGLLMGLAQAVTVGLASHTIGASKAYEDIVQGLSKLLRQSDSRNRSGLGLSSLVTPSIAYATGTFLCAYVLRDSTLLGSGFGSESVPDWDFSRARAVGAGIALVFGSRVAGGCTSGHCLSGLANFSLSSGVTGAAMFAAGVAVAKLLQ